MPKSFLATLKWPSVQFYLRYKQWRNTANFFFSDKTYTDKTADKDVCNMHDHKFQEWCTIEQFNTKKSLNIALLFGGKKVRKTDPLKSYVSETAGMIIHKIIIKTARQGLIFWPHLTAKFCSWAIYRKLLSDQVIFKVMYSITKKQKYVFLQQFYTIHALSHFQLQIPNVCFQNPISDTIDISNFCS